MVRNLSLWLLLGLVGVIGLLFFHVVKPFLLVTFIAAVLAVLFTPLHRWLTSKLWGHDRIAAAVTTILVIVLILLPISVTLLMAGTQVMQAGNQVSQWFEHRSDTALDNAIDKLEESTIGSALDDLHQSLPDEQQKRLESAANRMADSATAELYDKTRGLLSDVFTAVIGLGLMVFGLYYFLADRALFVGELHRMLPLDDVEERKLIDRFQQVCRGVVLGTVVAGIAQATLAGIAFGILGIPQAWILIVLTMFCSFIPFLGSATVWGPVAIWLFAEGRVSEGIFLAIYGAAIIATADNVVRAYVIGNQARLHPLVALVTVLGAIKLIGLWGIFVGPMVAAFLYALLNITKERFSRQQHNSRQPIADAPHDRRESGGKRRVITRVDPVGRSQLAN